MTQTSRERIEQLAWLAVMAMVGLAAVIGGLAYGLEADDRVGPGVMPFVSGLLILGPLAVQLVRRLRTPATDAPREASSVPSPADPAPSRTVRPETIGSASRAPHVAVIFAILASVVALSWLIGLLLSVSLLVGVLFWLNDRSRPAAALIAMVIAGLFGWIVFGTLLDVPLPRGLLGLI